MKEATGFSLRGFLSLRPLTGTTGFCSPWSRRRLYGYLCKGTLCVKMVGHHCSRLTTRKLSLMAQITPRARLDHRGLGKSNGRDAAAEFLGLIRGNLVTGSKLDVSSERSYNEALFVFRAAIYCSSVFVYYLSLFRRLS